MAPTASARGGALDRIRRRNIVAVAADQRQAGTALRARIRLRVKTPVRRIVVLAPARLAHRERRHRRRGPVVGHVARDGEPRPAVGAVGERVAIAAVGRVEDFADAFRAGREIRRNRHAQVGATRARHDGERVQSLGCDGAGAHIQDLRRRRRLVDQPIGEIIERALRPERIDDHAGGVVADAAGHALFRSAACRSRAESPHPGRCRGLRCGGRR